MDPRWAWKEQVHIRGMCSNPTTRYHMVGLSSGGIPRPLGRICVSNWSIRYAAFASWLCAMSNAIYVLSEIGVHFSLFDWCEITFWASHAANRWPIRLHSIAFFLHIIFVEVLLSQHHYNSYDVFVSKKLEKKLERGETGCSMVGKLVILVR